MQHNPSHITLREKCLYLEFFWPVFSRIRTEYGDIQSMRNISPYSVRMREMIVPEMLKSHDIFSYRGLKDMDFMYQSNKFLLMTF